jgi:hypothetical protein
MFHGTVRTFAAKTWSVKYQIECERNIGLTGTLAFIKTLLYKGPG